MTGGVGKELEESEIEDLWECLKIEGITSKERSQRKLNFECWKDQRKKFNTVSDRTSGRTNKQRQICNSGGSGKDVEVDELKKEIRSTCLAFACVEDHTLENKIQM
ncbi:hypothetical protein RUM44_002454 [Polyplax serrata]|uniref:Uncharacterized protein n=1 Tax=Polyplax serrata TaxID=468196 RepID=A0ABR1AGC8_POLSC